jgi:hypothetical protein
MCSKMAEEVRVYKVDFEDPLLKNQESGTVITDSNQNVLYTNGLTNGRLARRLYKVGGNREDKRRFIPAGEEAYFATSGATSVLFGFGKVNITESRSVANEAYEVAIKQHEALQVAYDEKQKKSTSELEPVPPLEDLL